MLEPMMGAAGRMLTNTSKQLGPLVEAHPASLKAFLPQTGPASSATEVFHYLRECAYREATLNPRTGGIARLTGKLPCLQFPSTPVVAGA